ncbi:MULTISPECIES: 3-isopropylmalate dehydratase small subunit [Malaciobacter]|jgi:3-isopropylmalate/(R)-2-methylmalate dehydratase small subunit|uniref:3-isopropylmalate dehydratase small subunit n=2 Tax=Malaciobacter TaxID=2321114 RepID=A0AB36ZY19_9BACT|nr:MULTISPECIES: 3-isopropylmalate dehydratase small subunit [Malaciobacter]PHO10180.1 3-isopropylmalate dehydratase small subunit [Malaciobacter canalis]PPK62167.1 3-isopropylmalate/(R)-2-methylmalate dehydratase small subunit [Malaciobacter marinus]QEE32671.1 isopropylmalate isomerase, small subunit [Malaciobacter canalis]SKB28729.1 3-isopropylmalate/(R)-2-methylmalate dehydratase small subunit [Malaciobacter marinus]
MNVITGKVWNFGANIDTDIIIAARYLNSSEPEHLAKYVMEDADPDFPKKLQKGDIIVAGENFGCGSSREHAPIALKAAGVAAVVAPSFARIFYRNAFNMGLPIFELPEALEIKENDEISIDLDNGKIINNTTNKSYEFIPIPEFMQELISVGGLINYAKEEIKKENNEKL